MSENLISHAVVLPDQNFDQWLRVLRPYITHFPRVAVVRSPRGNDLNRYRNVTAVRAPLTWFQDDPLAHIRRIYPSVVRVDVINASTPAQLEQVLNQRIQQNDRYGEKISSGAHLWDRFVLEWPTDHHPLRITRRFNDAPGSTDNSPGIDIEAHTGAKVLAGAGGIVTKIHDNTGGDSLQLGRYVQIASSTRDSKVYITTYGMLGSVSIFIGQQVKVGDQIGTSATDRFKVVVQNPPGGLSGFRLSNVIDPTDLIYVQGLRVQPTVEGLRVRSLPSSSGQVLGRISPWDRLEPLEMHGRTLAKVGVDDAWIRIKLPDGRTGYSAAWYLEGTLRLTPIEVFPGVNPVGVNLDRLHPLGAPAPSRLGGLGWVRLGYNVSNYTGSTDLKAAYERYAPLVESYARAGYKVLFATSHQTYGEGRIEYWPWPDMTDDKWKHLTERFAGMMHQIAAQWAGKGLVHAWQVWNEQDAPIGAMASVPMLAHNYANMLTQSLQAIRSSDSNVYVITGGHTGGPGRGAQYARETLSAMPSTVRPDGIAFHPYGRGTEPGPPYTIFGHIDESMREYGGIMPDRPVWITEWGVLDRPNDDPAHIAAYAMSFINHLKAHYPGRVATMIWYAWAQGMHNGYGIVGADNRPREPLASEFLKS